jgi:hypothetical protein
MSQRASLRTGPAVSLLAQSLLDEELFDTLPVGGERADRSAAARECLAALTIASVRTVGRQSRACLM